MTNHISETVVEIAHNIAKAAHSLVQNPSEKAEQLLRENNINNISTTLWSSPEGRIIVAKGSGESYNVEHDPELRRSLLNIVLFSKGKKGGEERLSQAMDKKSLETLEKVIIPESKTQNPKVTQLFPKQHNI